MLYFIGYLCYTEGKRRSRRTIESEDTIMTDISTLRLGTSTCVFGDINREIMEKAKANGIDALELSFSYDKYMNILDLPSHAAELGKNVGVDAEHDKNTFLSFFSVEEAQYYADHLTEEAISAIRKYRESDTLCALATWLATRKK